MSYEGYTQLWCKNGHHWSKDAYEDDNCHCLHCDSPPIFRNEVDDTNCDSYGYIEPELVETQSDSITDVEKFHHFCEVYGNLAPHWIDTEALRKACVKCNLLVCHMPAIYKIPTKDTVRTFRDEDGVTKPIEI